MSKVDPETRVLIDHHLETLYMKLKHYEPSIKIPDNQLTILKESNMLIKGWKHE